MNYDIFNGDADGIIALLQLRLTNPQESTLITGVKRDINLVSKVDAKAGDSFTVLDISMEKNRVALELALSSGAEVFYADHHRAGDVPEHENLSAHIDLDANTCTALIVDKLLNGQFHEWAITAAYGDNLIAKADELASVAGLSFEQKSQLKELGTLINYNGYGAKVDDLHFDPAALYQALLQYSSPFDVIADKASPFYQLQAAYQFDMDNALAIKAQHKSEKLGLFELPNEAWARRISGVYGNLLANQNPDSAHAVLTQNSDGTCMVSLRAPLNNKQGAGEICSSFATGGGREAAAGINALPKEKIAEFITVVENKY
ncbi:DHH family phosphoesterase [Aliivibrio finisterrensis]|uniref:DHHA1 domain-containing protein n=1 Tax=Aliivibrio finisterrensis TaxID=511998 RepID=UPI00101F4889|nr:DHH family phosphoesterase [Aliivibrio finisterrensis]RYU65219.1 DHH family phosphoesterase [Aliivibrio finisterrensis]RYU68593.1 DHH family phosphoesterase [Aliivibrio finisterrensis]RYU72016.1 DHH family phosphoesterase [Aliivibrio finisterrensis]